MSLKDEKVLLKEIDQLKQSKKLVSHLAANNDSISSERKSSQSISEHLSAKNAELDVLKKKIEEQKQILDSLNEANSERRAVLPALFKDHGRSVLQQNGRATHRLNIITTHRDGLPFRTGPHCGTGVAE